MKSATRHRVQLRAEMTEVLGVAARRREEAATVLEAVLAQIPAEHQLVATAPLRATFADGREGPWIAAFRRDLERLASEAGLPFLDLTEALPPEDFITSNHLHDRNHMRMAELLADHIAAEMER